MARDLTQSLLGTGGLEDSALDDGTDLDPMSSMGNLMDVMLVFVCGLLIALITHWNVSVDAVSSPDGAVLREMEGDLTELASSLEGGSDVYEELGTVFRDRETGQLFVVE